MQEESQNDQIKYFTNLCKINHLRVTPQRIEIYKEIIKIFNKEIKKRSKLFKASLNALKGYTLDKQTREKIISLLSDINKEIRIIALRVLKEEQTILN